MTSPPGRSPRAFPTTQLSLVDLAARPRADGFRDAWERFFRAYWTPLHAYLIRSGSSPDEALDVLQDFFTDGLEGKILQGYDPTRGRLRTYLLACLKNVRRKSTRRERARPDQQTFAFLEDVPGVPEPTADDPDDAFEREWTRVLCDRALAVVRQRLSADAVSLRLLDDWVLAAERPDAGVLAADLGITTANLYTRATRMRHALVKAAESEARCYAGSAEELRVERDEALRLLQRAAPAP